MCFINNYTAFVLSIINMTFRGLHDAYPLDPSVLVLKTKTQVALSRYRASMYFIIYQLIFPVVTCNLYIINYK